MMLESLAVRLVADIVSFVIQTNDGGGGDDPMFVLDRKEDQPGLWLMPG